jgi:hypothetical protein
MDLNLTQLAYDAKDALAPALPYLLPVAAEAGKEVVKSTAVKISEGALNRAQALWRKLWPQLQNKPAAVETARNLAKMPLDDDAQGAFSLQLKKLFAEDGDLAHDVAKMLVDSSVHVAASGERSVAANTVTNSIIVTGDRK